MDRYLADDPDLRAAAPAEGPARPGPGRPAEAGRRLDALAREQPQDAGITADLAAAELGAGRWSRALDLYGRMLDADPENREVLAAYREILLAHAPRVELIHSTLLQTAATHHVEEAAWRGWLADRWWLRAGARYGSYHQDRVVGRSAFSEEVWTALATVGFQPTRALSLWAGLEESRRREDIYRTTGRLGAAYDDAKATSATVDVAIRELLTNPVAAIPRNGIDRPGDGGRGPARPGPGGAGRPLRLPPLPRVRGGAGQTAGRRRGGPSSSWCAAACR